MDPAYEFCKNRNSSQEKGIFENDKTRMDVLSMRVCGTPDAVRTHDPSRRRRILYPAELLAHTYIKTVFTVVKLLNFSGQIVVKDRKIIPAVCDKPSPQAASCRLSSENARNVGGECSIQLSYRRIKCSLQHVTRYTLQRTF